MKTGIKRYLVTGLIMAFFAVLAAQASPRIVILATGGTIAGTGVSSTGSAYKPSVTTVEKLLDSVPEIKQLAEVSGEQISNISSQDMTVAVWLKLAARVNQLFRLGLADGIVITHGTDTMEETAWFLNLVVESDKPVIVTGSMRPGSALSADGAMNLFNAVGVAASIEARDKGVMVVMNDRIYAARGVSKCDTINPAAFDDLENGPLGRVNYGKVSFTAEPARRHTHNSLLKVGHFASELPEVAVVYGYAGIDAGMVKSVCQRGIKGLVYAGVGNGNPSAEVLLVLSEAVKNGMFVVRASRIPAGPVTLDAEVDDAKHGFIVSDSLSPQKARILLMLAINQRLPRNRIQQLFFEY